MTDDLAKARQRGKRKASPPAGTFGLTGAGQVRADRVLSKVDAAAEDRDPGAYYAGKTPTPGRITAALDMRDLYGPEVDQALGGEEPMVDEWESGVRVPALEQIRALSELTGLPVRFFYLPAMAPFDSGFICGSDGCHPLGTKEAETCPHCRQPMP